MDIGEAVNALRAGLKVTRRGWNGRGMYLVYVPGTESVMLRADSTYAKALMASPINIKPHIDMYCADGEMQPGWLASQADMLATDWEVIT